MTATAGNIQNLLSTLQQQQQQQQQRPYASSAAAAATSVPYRVVSTDPFSPQPQSHSPEACYGGGGGNGPYNYSGLYNGGVTAANAAVDASPSRFKESLYNCASGTPPQRPVAEEAGPPFVCVRLVSTTGRAYEFSTADIERVMAVFGQVQRVMLLVNNEVALVAFATGQAAVAAAQELHGTALPQLGTLLAVTVPAGVVQPLLGDLRRLTRLVQDEVFGQQQQQQQQQSPRQTAVAMAPLAAPAQSGAAGAVPYGWAGGGASPTLGPSSTTTTTTAAAPVEYSIQYQSAPLSAGGKVPGDSSSSSTAQMIGSGREFGGAHHPPGVKPKRRVCRVELVDLFGHHPEFDVVENVCGKNGNNINYILKEAKERCDIDLDGVPVNNAPVAERLHLTVTALDDETYNTALETLEDLLTSVCQAYAEFCRQRGIAPPPTIGYRRHEYIEGAEGNFVYLGPKGG